MENFEIIVSLAGTAFSLLVACITFIIKMVKAIKARVAENGSIAVLNTVAKFVEVAEKSIGLSGAEKRAYVLVKVKEFAIENGIAFDCKAVEAKIEELIGFIKSMNKSGETLGNNAVDE